MPALVKLLEWEAMRKPWRGVSASPVSRFALPKAASSAISLPWAIATAQPGWS
ncbi:hypothetical protein D3C87_2149900 [compost metagenome]